MKSYPIFKYIEGSDPSFSEVTNTNPTVALPLRFTHAEGYAEMQTASLTAITKHFEIKDWLGSVRYTFKINSGNTVVADGARDYYPYGLQLPGRILTSGNEDKRGRFTDHEHDEESNYDYHGARYYNPELGRYMSIDPLARERVYLSPYNYCQDNPIMRIDPNGEVDAPYVDEDGNYLGTDGNLEDHETRVIKKEEWDKVKDPLSIEGTAQLNSKSTKLNEWTSGINITYSTWQTIMCNGGKRERAYISNNSTYTVYFKPEGNVRPSPGSNNKMALNVGSYPLAPGEQLYIPFDGIACKEIKRGAVLKVVDGFTADVTNTDINLTCYLKGSDWSFSWGAQMARGGWKSTEPDWTWIMILLRSY